MTTLSSHFSLPLSDHWTPEQALAVYELLTDLAETVWNHYELAREHYAFVPKSEVIFSHKGWTFSSFLDRVRMGNRGKHHARSYPSTAQLLR